MKENRKERKIYLIIGFFLLGCGIMYAIFFCRLMISAYQAQSWIAVPYHIDASSSNTFGDGKGLTRRTTEIFYSYQYEGKTYSSTYQDFFHTGPRCTSVPFSLSFLTKTFRDNPANTKQHCWINPRKPQQSVLTRDLPMVQLIFILILTLSTFFGGMFLLIKNLYHKPKKKSTFYFKMATKNKSNIKDKGINPSVPKAQEAKP